MKDDFALYGYFRSSAAFRARIALNLKGIKPELRFVHLLKEGGQQHTAEYKALNPLELIPALAHGGHLITQSLAIMEYLDEIKPAPRLLPDDIRERAYARSLALMTIADAHPLTVPRVRMHLAKAFGAETKAIEEWGAHWTTEALAAYERFLARRAPAPFALGKDVGLADICIAGQVVGAQYLKVGLDAFPLVKELSGRCFALPEFSNSHPFEQPDYKTAGAKH